MFINVSITILRKLYMSKKIGISIGLVVLAVIIIGVYTSATMNTNNESTVGDTRDAAPLVPNQMVTSTQSQTSQVVLGTQSDIVDRVQGVYEVYAPEKIARAEIGPVVLFFHASWCPSCRRLNADIEKNSTLIPDGVTVLKVDYDTSTDLKKKYGVTTQHTLVQVDQEGNLIKKWTGSSQLSKLISEIQ